MAKKKIKYWTPENILKTGADYMLVYGERSNGKTTGCLIYCLEQYCKSGYKNQTALIRRWAEDFKGKNGSAMCNTLISLGLVEKYSKGEYNSIYYYSSRWYLCLMDDEGKKIKQCKEPFMYAFSIASEEHYKSTSYPDIKFVLFDEFITRTYYLPNEFIGFQNLLSTIIRNRDEIKIFMLGNTINQYCPYFAEMGLKNVKNQKQGTIDIYSYSDSSLLVAVEYCESLGDSGGKVSNKYFGFNNPKLNMIKSGVWEIGMYPHLPCKYTPAEVMYNYFIIFDEVTLHAEVIFSKELNTYFTYIHRKSTPIKDDGMCMIYSDEVKAQRNHATNILKPYNKITEKVASYYINNRVFYQDNEVGEVMRNYLIKCGKAIV